MNTTFEELYDSFKGKVTDFEFLTIDDEDEMLIMEQRLKGALAKFKAKKRNIIPDFVMEEFNRELSLEEIDALSYWLVYEWITPKVNSVEWMEHRLNTREFQGYSEANHLKEMQEIKKSAKAEATYWSNQINDNAEYVLGGE